MAKLVEIIGITHNPILGRMLANPGDDPVISEIQADYELMRRRLAEAKPDVLVTIASDHLNQWFMDNMPAFLVGKAPVAKGPFPYEQKVFGLPSYEAPVHTELARYFVAEGFHRGVDFAFSDEFTIDHAFTVPLSFVRPEADLPIVPVWTNVMAAPMPPAARFFTVGEALRALIEASPLDLRVAVVASGHLSIEIGGPKLVVGSPDELFDRRMMELITAGKAKEVVHDATPARMTQAGNMTPGFLNYVMLLGLAGGTAPRSTALRFPKTSPAVYYMEWTFDGAATR
jgi:protocatechuate 4,5-dioxygenase beta chain